MIPTAQKPTRKMISFKEEHSKSGNLVPWHIYRTESAAAASLAKTNGTILYTKKMAAIMFTDIVGYTDMMDKNEDATLQLLRENIKIQRSCIHSFNGTWIKEMGDGILSIFSSATNAVECALQIQKAVQKIQQLRLHIGIHFDKVIFMEQDVYGNGVNIAARIQESARPDKIWVSRPVLSNSNCNHTINFRSVGRQNLRNIKIPVDVYEIDQA